MDNLTHSLFALTLGNAGLRRAGRGATATLLIASNVPDIEIVTTFTSGRIAYLAVHRGPTHGLAGLALGVAVALAVHLVQRYRGVAGRARFSALLAIATIGVAAHIAMDCATSYGTRVLSPFVRTWYGVDWVPIADIVLLAILAGGLLAARLRPHARARAALAALVLMGANYAFHAALQSAALSRAMTLQASIPGASVAARPSAVFRYLDRDAPSPLPAALPTLGSPFTWRVIVRAPDGYLVTDVNLLADSPGWQEEAGRRGVWFPGQTGTWVERAATARLARIFLDFSRFASTDVVRHANGDVTVHWYELRFAEGRAPRGGDLRTYTSPFGAWVRLSPDGRIVREGWGPG